MSDSTTSVINQPWIINFIYCNHVNQLRCFTRQVTSVLSLVRSSNAGSARGLTAIIDTPTLIVRLVSHVTATSSDI